MGIFKYLCKVLKNKNDVYEYEKRILKEAVGLLITFLACLSLLVFPPLRVVLKWMAYFSVGCCAIFILCVFVNSLKSIGKSFRYAKKLEKLGTSVEEEAMAISALCNMEGDDGLPSEEK